MHEVREQLARGRLGANTSFFHVARRTYVSHKEALQQAHTGARGDLTVTESAIRYIAFEPSYHDWRRIEFVRVPQGWVKTLTSLPPEEWLPDEQVTDEQIVESARKNRMLAIRLYRARYGVGLAEAVTGLDALSRR